LAANQEAGMLQVRQNRCSFNSEVNVGQLFFTKPIDLQTQPDPTQNIDIRLQSNPPTAYVNVTCRYLNYRVGEKLPPCLQDYNSCR